MKLADSIHRLSTETAFSVLAEVNKLKEQGKDILSFAIGEPDFDTPEHIKQAAKDALDRNETHYNPAIGIPPLRNAIAQYLEESRGVPVDPDLVAVMPGAKPALFHCILSAVGPGDEVVYPNPGFPMYESLIRYSGAKPVPLPLLEDREFSFDHDQLRSLVNDKTAMIILNSPHNPTGGVYTPADLELIAELANKYDTWVFTDEVYCKLVYDGQFHSLYHLDGMQERTILVDGFSKTYAMTGWRLGYAVVPKLMIKELTTFLVNSVSCTSTPTQFAGIAALTGPQDSVASMRAEFLARRDLLVDGLNAIDGISCVRPGGAFYAFPNVTGVCRNLGLKDASALQQHLLHNAGVAVLERICFGSRNDGEGEEYLRFSYASSTEVIQAGLERIANAVQK